MTVRLQPATKACPKRRSFIVTMAGAIGSICCGGPQTRPVTTPDPVAFNACRRPERSAFSILSWNVFMMPGWIHESPRNEARAAAIAATLLERDFDVICLQKAFDRGAVDVMDGVLAEKYPHRFGPANDWCSLKINSGIYVLSRTPLADFQSIQFDDCNKIECMSRKGAVLVSLSCAGKPVRLIVTHLQGEEGKRFTPEGQNIRDRQISQLQRELIAPNTQPLVPFVICGDLGTPRLSDDGRFETAAYRRMLATFKARNGVEPRITLDDDSHRNDMARDGTRRRNELDYILDVPNGLQVDVARTRHIFRRPGWDDSSPPRIDLSYRYAVGAIVSLREPVSSSG